MKINLKNFKPYKNYVKVLRELLLYFYMKIFTYD